MCAYLRAVVQAWGCMEAELGNVAQARGLFKAGVSLAPDNDACWTAWIRMEEENDLLDRANALRSHRFETAERDALPASFSTLPSEGGAVIGTVRLPPRSLHPHVSVDVNDCVLLGGTPQQRNACEERLRTSCGPTFPLWANATNDPQQSERVHRRRNRAPG